MSAMIVTLGALKTKPELRALRVFSAGGGGGGGGAEVNKKLRTTPRTFTIVIRRPSCLKDCMVSTSSARSFLSIFVGAFLLGSLSYKKQSVTLLGQPVGAMGRQVMAPNERLHGIG